MIRLAFGMVEIPSTKLVILGIVWDCLLLGVAHYGVWQIDASVPSVDPLYFPILVLDIHGLFGVPMWNLLYSSYFERDPTMFSRLFTSIILHV